jgi:hypothetical protein
VYASNQRTHIRGGAWTGDEYEIALQALSAKTSRIEQVSRPFDNRFRGEYGNVRSREQADLSRVTPIDGDANRTCACNSREGVGDAEITGSEFLF